MKWAKPLLYFVFALGIGGSALFVGYTVGLRNAPAASGEKHGEGGGDEKKDVTAKVKVVQARMGRIEKTVAAYGTVLASPEDIQTLSVPFECVVRRVRAVAGQAVEAGAKVVDVEPSPETLLALADALSTKEAAQRDLVQMQQRLEMKLATRTELSTVEQTLRMAQAKLESLQKRGIEARSVAVPVAGLVSRVVAQEGQVVAAGGALVEVVAADRVQVKLGVEPASAGEVQAGQTIHLRAVADSVSADVDATVKLVTRRVNPASRLVDVYASLPARSPLMLETFVKARIVTEARQALVVPRSAVLSEQDQDKHVLFTVEDGKAAEHEVEIGLEDEQNVELRGTAVKSGDEVVIQGNAELENGMAVEVEGPGPSAEPAGGSHSITQPAIRPTSTKTGED